MRVERSIILRLLFGLTLAIGLLCKPAQAGEVRKLHLSSGSTGTRAEIMLDRESEYTTLALADPDRLVIDLPGSALAASFAPPAPVGLVKAVRSGRPTPGTTRIVFDLHDAVTVLTPRFENVGAGEVRLVLEWPGESSPAAIAAVSAAGGAFAAAKPPPRDPVAAASDATSRLIASLPSAPAASPTPGPPGTAESASPAQILAGAAGGPPGPAGSFSGSSSSPPARTDADDPVAAPSPSPPSASVSAPSPDAVPMRAKAAAGAVKTMRDVARRGGLRPLVIAIDAGHGGQDGGARGPSGTLEKHITLQVAKELARQVDATPGLKAYLTRDADFFIPLAQRYQKARAAKADLFVSIHADAFTNSTASGSSVFVLSQRGASSQAAKWLANQENAADLVGGVRLQGKDNTLASVLLDLSQSATMKASEDMARHVLDGLRRLGKTHKPHVERANFVVLRSPDVPSMLVETAFITNPAEERKLRDPAHQRRLASAILDGVNAYFTRQPPPGTLYAARAEAGRPAPGGKGGSP